MSSDDTNVQWIRKLRPHEVFHEITQRNNTLLTVYQLAVASDRLLKSEDVMIALRHLYRKVINFRLAIRERSDGELWFCEMEKEKIDFTILHNTNIEDEFDKTSEEQYDCFNGPLWRVKLQHEVNLTDYHSLPGIEEKYCHHYTFLICTHHAISDGYSKMKKIRLFLQLLNAVLAQKPIDDAPFGYLSNSEETDQLIESRLTELKMNSNLFEEVQQDISNLVKLKTIWPKITNNHIDINPKTFLIRGMLDNKYTKELVKKFKSFGVSFHAGFFSLVNIAMVDMMKEGGKGEEEYSIVAIHGINSRRYWISKEKDDSLGNEYGTITFAFKISADVRSSIIQHIKEYHSKLHSFIENKRSIDEFIFSKLLDENGKNLTAEEYMKHLPPMYTNYVTSNMGDVTTLIGTGGDHVQLTYVNRSTSIQNLNYPLLFMVHTFRGRLIIGLECNTRYIPKSVAEELLNKTLHLCKSV